VKEAYDKRVDFLIKESERLRGKINNPDNNKKPSFETFLTEKIEKVIGGIQTRIIKN
jgi:hypothetical protein